MRELTSRPPPPLCAPRSRRQVYGRISTRRIRVIPHGPIHAGSTVSFAYDAATRAVSCAVDGAEQGVLWVLPADLRHGASSDGELGR